MTDIEIDENDINDREIFDEMTDSTDISIQQILISMISDKENISLKTEIHNVKALTFLYMFKEYVKLKEYETFAKFLNSQIEIYMEFMVSKNRASRKEIEHILSSWIDRIYSNKSNQLNVRQIE